MTFVTRIRRAFAVISGLCLLQLTLSGSGTLCAMEHGTSHDVSADAGTPMAGMQMAGVSQPMTSHAIVVSSSDDSDGPMSPVDGADSHGCPVPIAPGPCGSMSGCAIGVAAADVGGASVSMRVIEIALPSPMSVHSGPTLSPELPPPRA